MESDLHVISYYIFGIVDQKTIKKYWRQYFSQIKLNYVDLHIDDVMIES